MIWLALAILVLWPLAAHRLRKPVGDTARSRASGQFATLSMGLTHYDWNGPRDGRVLVAIHGLTTAGYVWDAALPELTRMGYRVLRYDLYGRGLSDAPGGAQDSNYFTVQLSELLHDQGIGGPISLIGYSMGGGIATSWAARNPDRVEELMLVAPAGLGRVGGPFARFCAGIPVIGDGVMRALGGIVLRFGFVRAARSFPDSTPLRKQLAETRVRGFLPAVLSSYRNMLAEDQAGLHAELAARSIPVLAVWGGNDKVIPATSTGRLAQINRQARQVSIPDAGHGLPYTHPRELREAVQTFLRGD
ncbi:hypothetical protein ACMU_00465 [Actibacterium mucosum KCTC 23349]|uniref:AB hydrolase-1 domain-containing protein n=1 Tax=Actibacterium mucosum KCTC 23349 TaxID=1454373 RepID=A0A037ZLM9_9RHOB|nr:alpha/beta hydrolase [Actibacterium mucosum]KAJ56999.1 hypothetical protein ACMU_00465 [Actibacterium mucosum KCTC 23349]